MRALLLELVLMGLDVRSFDGPFPRKNEILTTLMPELAPAADILIPLDRLWCLASVLDESVQSHTYPF